MSLGRLQLVGKLMDLGLPRSHADRAVSVVLDEVAGSLAAGKGVAIRNFGTFLLRESRRSVMFDPRAGSARNVERGVRVRFRPSREFERKLEGGP